MQRDDPRRAQGHGGARVQRRPALNPHALGQEQHPDPHLVQEQQEAARKGQGFVSIVRCPSRQRQTLQHGARERQGDVDRNTKVRRRKQEGEACQQG